MTGAWEERGTWKWPAKPPVLVTPQLRSDEREGAALGRSMSTVPGG